MTYSRTMRPVLVLIAAAGCLAATAPALAQPAAPAGRDFKKLVDEKAAAIVSIKYVLTEEGEQDEEEVLGVMLEPTGLVMTQTPGGPRARMMKSSPTPTEIMVMVGDDTQGVKAKIMARDSDLGLAWLQITDAPAKPYAAINFSSAPEPKLGDGVVMVPLMGKFFDRAPIISETHIAAAVTKPRKLWIPSIGFAQSEMSLPIFDMSGQVIGINTLILPEREEMQGPGSQTAFRGVTSGMILPAAEVVAATERAKELAKTTGGEEPKPADAPKPEDKPEPKPGETPPGEPAPK